MKKTRGFLGFQGGYLLMHTSSLRGHYGLYGGFLASLAPIFDEIVALVEDLGGRKFKPIL